MTHRVRLAVARDLDRMVDLAAATQGGLTNFPNDRAALDEKIAWSERSCRAAIAAPEDEFYLFVLEEEATGRLVGTANIYSRVGVRWPFYSYKLSRITHMSRGIGRHFSTEILTLVNDFDDASEVGGLFLHPDARGGGLAQLLARSRYLFIARHRPRFADRTVAELRGWTRDDVSPFWEAVGRKFFDREFIEADFYNATQGNQFIADLMPRFPVYTALLPGDAQAVIGRPHAASVPAKAMLEAEGFVYDGYVDIFDAGPTLHARTDRIATITALRTVDGGSEVAAGEAGAVLRAEGTGLDFVVRLLARTPAGPGAP